MGFLDRVKTGYRQAAVAKASLALTLARTTVRAGEPLDYHLVITSSGPLRAEQVTLGLYGRERVRVWTNTASPLTPGETKAAGAVPEWQAGAARETATFQHVAVLSGAELTLNAGQPVEYRGTLAIPPNLQPTYRGTDAQHIWRVRAILVVPLAVDFVAEVEVTVR